MNERLEVNISYLLDNDSYSDIKQLKELFALLQSKNVTTITLDDDPNISNCVYLKIIKYIKYANFIIEFKNNGTDISKRGDILNYFDAIRLEIDSTSSEVLDKMYHETTQYHNSMMNYNYLKKYFNNLSIQIDTYFTRFNFRNLGDMYTLISSLDIEKWNILHTSDISFPDDAILSKELIDTLINFYNSTDLSDKINSLKKEESKMKIKSNKKLPCTLLRVFY